MMTFYIARRGGSWRHNSLFSKPGFISEGSRSSKSWLMTADDDDVDIVGKRDISSSLTDFIAEEQMLVLCCAKAYGYGYGDDDS